MFAVPMPSSGPDSTVDEPDSTANRPDSVVDAELAGRLDSYRHTREQIEHSILPLASSVDGTSFTFQASPHGLVLRRGGYVTLESRGQRRLGQITDLAADSTMAASEGLAGPAANVLIRLVKGSGIVLDTDGGAFHDAGVRPARADEVGSWFSRSRRPDRAGLTIGELLFAPTVPAVLDSGGLGRHTFVCGQSGSGKTYALGLLLERVLAETSLRVVILDPNSDFVGLPRIRERADPQLVARYAPVCGEIAVWQNDPATAHPLRLRFHDLGTDAQAAILGLDPIGDREEFAVLAGLLRRQHQDKPLISNVHELLDSDDPDTRRLGLRANNLGVLHWSVWSPTLPSLVEELRAPTARCTVVDLGSLDTTQEQRLVAEAVLSTLWQARMSRRPCLVVIDEAHNICPATAADEVCRLAAQRAVQIAAEGRKYGLYLLTCTQRPHKVHESVVSQCDNLLLMRMNSPADVADLGRLLSFAPPGLMAGATSFRMGHALVAGRLLAQPAYVRMGERVSQEGGADIPVAWAAGPPAR